MARRPFTPDNTRQCPPLILLSLPLNYIMALIALLRRVILCSNMWAVEQTSAPLPEWRVQRWWQRKKICLNMNCGKEEWILKQFFFFWRMDFRVFTVWVEAWKDLPFCFQIRYVAYLFAWPSQLEGSFCASDLQMQQDIEWMTLQCLGGALRDLHSGKCVGWGGVGVAKLTKNDLFSIWKDSFWTSNLIQR